jgi:diguanylate cyclase (GGDEF)-like protein
MINFFVEAGNKNIYLDEKKIYFKEFKSLVTVINSMIKNRIKNEKKLEELTNKDPLTGAYNRRYFYDISQKLIAISKREHKPLSLAIIDIDNFKNINDTYGHDIGDEVIKALVNSINESIRESDILVRFGGEEFIILLPNISIEQTSIVMEKVRNNVQQLKLQGSTISFTISGGVSEYIDTDTIDTIVKRADENLYKAKKSGKNKILSSDTICTNH